MDKMSRSQKVFQFFNYLVLSLLGIVTLYPFWYVLVAYLNSGRDFTKGGVYFWPRVFTLENYKLAFENDQILTPWASRWGEQFWALFLVYFSQH